MVLFNLNNFNPFSSIIVWEIGLWCSIIQESLFTTSKWDELELEDFFPPKPLTYTDGVTSEEGYYCFIIHGNTSQYHLLLLAPFFFLPPHAQEEKNIWRGVVGFKPSPLALHWDDITAKEWGALTFSEACLTCCILIHGMICNWVLVFFTKILFWLGTSFFQMLLGCLTKECGFLMWTFLHLSTYYLNCTTKIISFIPVIILSLECANL